MRQRPRRRHLDQRDVGVRVGSDTVGPKAAAIGQADGDAIGTLNHMMVRQDITVRIDDEPGTRCVGVPGVHALAIFQTGPDYRAAASRYAPAAWRPQRVT